jgi:RNA polymerase sigma factor (sigma-70 family)
MEADPLGTISKDLRTLFEAGAIGGFSDGELLERFLASRDGAAFEILLDRHGPMVWGVCRRILPDYHDAEDAFQATFLVLARRAASVSPRASVAAWLHGVAKRIAWKGKAISARRRSRERSSPQMRDVAADTEEPWSELIPLLDQELSRLPERYRAVIVLCELEGLTRREAAAQLGWPEGTVASRLVRGRALLAGRLSRRGLALPLGAGALLLWQNVTLAAGVPRVLITATVGAACQVATGPAAAGMVSSPMLALARRAINGMLLKKVLLAVTLMEFGIMGGGLAYFALASGSLATGPEPQAAMPESPPMHATPTEQQVRGAIRSAVERAVASVPAIEDLEQRVWILCEIARLQARTGLADALEETLKSAVKAAQETESEHRLIDVAEVLAETGDTRAALALVDPLVLNHDYGLDHIAAAMARAGDVAGALETAATIRNETYKGEALRRIAIARAEGGDMKGALATAATISDQAALAQLMTAIAARQYRAHDPSAARSLEQAREAADKIPLYHGNDRTPSDHRPSALAEIARVLAESGAIDEARKVASGITKAPWGDIAWRNIVAAQAQRGETEAALQTAEHIQSRVDKAEAIKDIVAARARANDLATARALVARIEASSARTDAQLAIARAQYRSGRRQDAVTIFEAVRREAEHLEDNPRFGNVKPAALGRLAKVQAELGEEQAAQTWIDQQPAPIVKAWSLLGLANGMAERLPAPPPPSPRIRNLGAAGLQAASARQPDQKVGTPRKEAVLKPIASFRGKLLLFGSQHEDDLKTSWIEAINPDGTGLETVLRLDEGERIHSGRVSPDGKHLACSTYREGMNRTEAWLLATDRVRRKLADDVIVVAWSPDGSRLAGVRDTHGKTRDWENLVINVETGQEQRLPIPRTDVVEDWSPDGETLAVMAGNIDDVFQHPTKGTYPLRQIYLVKPDGSGRQSLTSGARVDCLDARFSPDGKFLTYFQRRHPEGRVLHFAVVQSRDRADARDLAQFDEIYNGNAEYKPNGSPCWSPEGMSVAWFIPRRKVKTGSMRIELLLLSIATGQASRLDLSQHGLIWVQAIDWR